MAKREWPTDRIIREAREKAALGEPVMEVICTVCGGAAQVFANPAAVNETVTLCRCCSFADCPLRHGGRHIGPCTCVHRTDQPHTPACPAFEAVIV